MIIYSLGYFYIGKFFNNNIEVNVFFESIFWIVIIAQPFNSIAFTFDGIFKGLGRAVELRNTLIYATFLVFAPLLFVVDYLSPGLHAIWIALSGWMVFRGLSLLIKFRKITT